MVCGLLLGKYIFCDRFLSVLLLDFETKCQGENKPLFPLTLDALKMRDESCR